MLLVPTRQVPLDGGCRRSCLARTPSAMMSVISMPPKLVPLTSLQQTEDDELLVRARQLQANLTQRRSVRHFSNRVIPNAIIDACLRVAVSAPSGANRQPWHFVVVQDPKIKRLIRLAAEAEEHTFYHERAPKDWLQALAPLGTDDQKPFLDEASHLIVIFAQPHGFGPGGDRLRHYYVQESVGIATGMLISILHQTGLASLTHTPSPMNFLNTILERPPHERPFLILAVGHPASGAMVPDIKRKSFHDVVTYRT